MQTTVEKVILIPRFTSYAGANTFLQAPMNIREYESAVFLYQLVATIGTIGPSITVKVQESPDLSIWYDAGPALVSGDPETRTFRFEWIRLHIEMSGTDPGFTCWCVGDFVRRRGA
jgi:hypothetical protein